MRVLIVEDELRMAGLIRRGPDREGLAADVAGTGEDALWMAEAHDYDAVVLDVMLPGIDGFETSRRLRDHGIWVPILMLTARDSVADRVAGLDAGADDYLVKPFAFAELLARLRALVRRGAEERPAVLEAGGLRLDPATRRAWRGERGGQALGEGVRSCSRRSCAGPGEVLSRLYLLEHAWDFAYENRSNIVDVYMRRLRQKIGDGRCRSRQCVGAGYRLRAGGCDAGCPDSRARRRCVRAGDGGRARRDLLVRLRARVSSHLDGSLNQDLRLRAQDLSALVRHGGSLAAAGGGHLVEPGESYAELLDRRGGVLDATPLLGRTALLTPQQVQRALRREIQAELPSVPGLDERSRLLAGPVDGKVLAVGATLSNNSETLASLRDVLLVAGPVALVLASLAGYLLAGLSLRPVERMRRRAATISGENIESRLPVPRTHDEIERLGETLNEMLGRIEEVLRRERTFVADAGHELRTPLTLLRTELELALRQGSSAEELREAIRGASAEVDRLTQLAEGLLLIARTDQGTLQMRPERIEAGLLFRELPSASDGGTSAGSTSPSRTASSCAVTA